MQKGLFAVYYIPNMQNNKLTSLPKKPVNQQGQPKQLSEQAAKKVANIISIMLNEKKR
jgi:hypothetical protein